MYWNNYGMQTPYSNPYGQTMQQALQPCSITKVSGENGAKAFGMAPNSSALLLDETAPLVWLKTTDGAGYPTLTPLYDYAVQGRAAGGREQPGKPCETIGGDAQ